MISSLPTFMGRHTAPSHGLLLYMAASIRSLRPNNSPETCGPRRPFPPLKQYRSTPVFAKRVKFEYGGMPAASSSSTGTPAGLVISRMFCRRSSRQVV